jgi:hypothetical protein
MKSIAAAVLLAGCAGARPEPAPECGHVARLDGIKREIRAARREQLAREQELAGTPATEVVYGTVVPAELSGPCAFHLRRIAWFEGKLRSFSDWEWRPLLAPLKKLEGKVTAVSTQFGLVIVNIGKDQGVLEGDEFVIYRAASFVAKIQIERVDRIWSAGRVVLKKVDPRVADSVSNDILVREK